MPAVTYNTLAVNCPAPQVPATYLDPTAHGYLSPVLPDVSAADAIAHWRAAMGYLESLGRAGAGVYGIPFGLIVTSADGSLVAAITAGQALLDDTVPIAAGTVTGGLATNTDNYLWVSRGGTFGKRTTADGGSKLLPPDNAQPWAFLRKIAKDASNNSTVYDDSGVVTIRGGIPYRKVGDPSMPGDTPPASWIGLTETQDGLYLWDGGHYRKLVNPSGSGDTQVISAKDTVRVVTAAALPAYTRVGNVITANASGGLPNQDGVSLSVNDRILVTYGGGAFGAHADNGIYTVTSLGSGGAPFVLTRAADADSSAKVTPGLHAWTSTEGTALANTLWLLTTAAPITLNTTALGFTNVVTSGGSTPSGAAGGDLGGSYPNPTLAAAGPGATGPVGDATHVAAVTIDAKGRVTALSSVAITGGPPSGAAGGDLAGTYPNPTIAPNAVTNAKAAQMASKTLKGNVTGVAANPADVSVSQVNAMLLDGATLDNSGAGGTAEIKAGGVGTGQIAANAVTMAKLATQADQTLLGNNTGGGAVPLALTAAQVRTLLGLVIGTNVAAQNDARFTGITANNQSGTSYTLVIGDAGLIIECNNAGAIALTIPANASVAFPVGTVIQVYQMGAGQVTVGITSDTLRAPNGAKTAHQYSVISIWKRASTEWVLSGDSVT